MWKLERLEQPCSTHEQTEAALWRFRFPQSRTRSRGDASTLHWHKNSLTPRLSPPRCDTPDTPSLGWSALQSLDCAELLPSVAGVPDCHGARGRPVPSESPGVDPPWPGSEPTATGSNGKSTPPSP